MDLFIALLGILVVYVLGSWYYRSLKLDSYDGLYIFITGCDTGFGHLLAQRLDKLGFHVFAACLTEMGEDNLRKKCSSRLVTLKMDVTNETSIKNAREFVESKLPTNTGLWGLVNNAGIAGEVGLVEWLKKEDYEKTLAVNFYGVVETTRRFLPLVRRTRGRVVNMASIMGTVTLPGAAAYCVSKHAVEVFSDCLRSENCRREISVHIIEPGYFDTGIAEPSRIHAAGSRTFSRLEQEKKDFYGEDYMSRVDTKRFLDLIMSKAVYKVVDSYTHALTARYPKYRYKVGWDANTLFRLARWAPEWFSDTVFGLNLPSPKGVAKM